MFEIKFNSEIKNFDNFDKLINFLNSALYYAKEVYIFEPISKDVMEYSELNESDIADYFAEILHYDCELLEVVQTF